MAKKRKAKKRLQIAGLQLSKPLLRTAIGAANTRVGRLLIAEALIVAAGLLVRKNPVPAVAAAGTEAVDATKSAASSAGEAAVSFINAAAERLRAGAGLDRSAQRPGTDAQKKRSGGNGGLWDHLDENTIRQALLGDFSRKKKSRKAKASRRH